MHKLTPAMKIADAKEDFDHWKETRKGFLTSSEVYAWREVDVPDWYAATNHPEGILAGKLHGVEKRFEANAETSVEHGTYDEEHIQGKFGHIVGCDVLPDNGLYVSKKWSHIAASIDGFGRPGDPGNPIHPELCQDRGLARYLRDLIDERDTVFLTEVKKSTSAKFQKTVPDYYVDQVKTQLSVLELDYAVIMADTIMRHPEQKWRWLWDFRAYVIERSKAWDAVLDQLNEEIKKSLDAGVKVCHNG